VSKAVSISSPSGRLECKSVGLIVMNPEHEVLLLDRRKGVLGWAGPAGHLESGEDPLCALRRELFEETGVELNSSYKLVLHADMDNACKRGFNSHEWWVYMLRAKDDRLELKEPEKHKGIGWFTLKEINTLELEPVWRTILSHFFNQP